VTDAPFPNLKMIRKVEACKISAQRQFGARL
jgi:hypothetical protein